MRNFLVYACLLIGIQTAHSQTSYTWNGSISTAWNNPSNWTPAGIPGTADNITIVTGGNICLLNASAAINNIILNSGQLNLNGFALTANGTTATFNAGSVQNGTLTVSGANATVFGTGPTVMNCQVSITSATITIKNTTFQGVTDIIKTGTTNDQSSGNNIFNGVLTVNNVGTGYLLFGNSNPDQFNAASTFNNFGSNHIYVAYGSSGHVFNGPVTFNNASITNTGIYVGNYSTSTTFNDDITVTSTSGQGVFFCNGNSTAAATLATGKTINIGAGGFVSGTLSLKQFTQTGTTPQNLTLTGSGALTVGPSSSFGGDFTYSGPGLFLNGCTYGGTVNVTKTGATNDFSNGNNIYNGVTTINNAGSGYLVLGDNNPDRFNADVTFNNTGTSNLYVAHNSNGHVFNGPATFNNTPAGTGTIYISSYSAGVIFNNNIVLTSTSGSGIYFCNSNATATTTLTAGNTISVGPGGFSAGTLSFKQFTQLGATPQTFAITGAGRLVITTATTFNGDLTASGPAIFLNGGIFNGATDLTKTGSSGDYNSGGNTFNGICSITNSGSSFWLLGNSNPDTWNNDVIFTDNGSERLLPCWATAGNQFNGNIYVNTSGSASGIQFCGGNTTATATLAAGKTILPGVTGLTVGYLYLKQFTQLGNTPINLTTAGASTLYLGPRSTFGGSVTATAPDIWAQGATYNSDVTFNKTGGSSNHNNQYLNIFNGTCTINQQSNSGYFQLGYNTDDQFNDDIIVTSVGTGGIYLGSSNGTGLPTQAAGKTILVGAAGFSTGFLCFKAFTQLGTAPINLTFTGTNTYLAFANNSVFGGNLTSNTPGLYFHGAMFKGKVDATKTGATNDAGIGGNSFLDSATINNAGGGYLILGNGAADTFYNAVHFNSSGSSYIGVGWNSAGNLFQGNITVSSTGSSTGIQFNSSAASAAVLTAGNTIQTGPAGFSSGPLSIRRFTQLGSGAVNLPLTGTSSLTLGPATTLGGDVIASSPTFYLNGCTFNGTSELTKTGTSGDYSSGGNIFNGVSSITNSGSNYWVLGNTNPDTWNSDVTFTDNGSERLLPCWASTGNQFNGNIYVNTSGSAQGIRFCGGNSTSTATLAAGKSVLTGAGGLNAGNLILKQFTQLGNAPVNLTMSSTATSIQYGPLSAFGGDVTSSSPGLFFNGCTFSGTVSCTKTGVTNDYSNGNNIFNGITTMTNAGTGYLVFGSGTADQFNAAATFNNTGTSYLLVAHNSANNIFGGVLTLNNTPAGNTGIYVSQNSPGTQFNDNIIVSSTSGTGVQFCNSSTGSATLSAGHTISIGAGGFSSGALILRQFTQTGPTAQNLNLTGTSSLIFGPLASFGGNLTTVSPGLSFNGGTYSGSVTSTKTGSTNDYSSGNNIFNGVTTMTNAGTGYLVFGNTNGDQFATTATFNNTGSSNLYVAHNSTNNIFAGVTTFNNSPIANSTIYVSQNSSNTQFNNDIVVTSTNGQGVLFCASSTGSASLSAGHTISVGGAGFTSGTLLLRQFTQTGATAQNLTLTGTGNLTFGPLSSFGGNVTTVSPTLYFNGCNFGGTVNSTKTGTTNDQSQGNNVFNGTSTFTDNATGYLLMCNNYADIYNGDVSFVQTNTGRVYPNYNYNGSYGGNMVITAPAASGIVLGANAGTAIFTGAGVQTISITAGTPVPVIARMTLANTGGGVTLNTPVYVSKILTLTSGLLNTTTANILTMQNGSVTSAGTALSTSYVNGPMRYQKSTSGPSTLNFPIGKDADCRPVILTINHTNGNLYTYEAKLFNASAANLGYTRPPSVDNVSKVHYYTITRTNAAGVIQPTLELSGNQTIQVFFGANDNVTNGATLTIVKNTVAVPNYWLNIGGTGAPAFSGGANLTGSIISISAPSVFNSFSTFALANVAGGFNVLPVGLLYFEAKANNDKVNLGWATSMEVNNSYFTVEKSRDGSSFTTLQKVNTKAVNGNSNATLNYMAVDEHPYSGISYYRLKQTDLDGNSRYSRTVVVTLNQSLAVSVYPNPTTGTVYITGVSANQNNMAFEWYDVSGKLMAKQMASVNNAGMVRLETNLRNGVYLLKFIAADGSMKLQSVMVNK
jgi:hypothetical protein